ncbi:MAG: BatD family protein, partial [Bacteroidota bacterium]
MKQIVAFILGFVFLGWIGPSEGGAQPQVTASINEAEIGIHERVIFTVSVRNSATDGLKAPGSPQTRGLAAAQAMPSVSRNVRVVEGEIVYDFSFVWVYHPVRVGEARIDPLEVVVDGSTHRTDELRVEVVSAARRGRRASAMQAETVFGPEHIFITATPSKQSVYVNEQIVVEYRLFFR